MIRLKMIKIESIEKYKGRTLKLTLLDAELAFINADTVSKFSISAGDTFDEEEWKEILHADEYRRARERALYLLDYRDHSYVELCKKLMKNYGEDICYEVADNLAESGLIDDARYAEALARRQCEVKLFGSYKARLYLREKGIPAALINEALEPYEETAAERAAELISRRYMKYFDPDDRALMQKLKNALARQGYSYSQIKDAIEIVMQECEEED